MSETIIIRVSTRRAGRAALVIPAPSSLFHIAPLANLRDAARLYAPLICWWTFASALLWPLTIAGLALVGPSAAALRERVPDRMPNQLEVMGWYLQAGLAAGAGTGAAQSLLLRQFFPRALWWIPASTAGWALGMVGALRGTNEAVRWVRTTFPESVYLFSSSLWERYLLLAVAGASLGLLLGLAQWIALRYIGPALRRSSTWLVASALGWMIGLAFVPWMPRSPDLLQRAGRYSGGMDYALPALILAGAAYGMLTAFALTLMLRAAAPQPLET